MTAVLTLYYPSLQRQELRERGHLVQQARCSDEETQPRRGWVTLKTAELVRGRDKIWIQVFWLQLLPSWSNTLELCYLPSWLPSPTSRGTWQRAAVVLVTPRLEVPWTFSDIQQRNVSPKKGNRRGFPGGAVVGNPPANAGDTGSIPGPGRFHMLHSN